MPDRAFELKKYWIATIGFRHADLYFLQRFTRTCCGAIDFRSVINPFCEKEQAGKMGEWLRISDVQVTHPRGFMKIFSRTAIVVPLVKAHSLLKD
jgi:hypothetical protein